MIYRVRWAKFTTMSGVWRPIDRKGYRPPKETRRDFKTREEAEIHHRLLKDRSDAADLVIMIEEITDPVPVMREQELPLVGGSPPMDMRVFDGGKYLKSSDIDARQTVTIQKVASEVVGEEEKPVVYFCELNKGLVLNSGNRNRLTDAWGWESDCWVGQTVELWSEPTTYRGERVRGLRVAPSVAVAATSQPTRRVVNLRGASRGGAMREEVDDDIAF